MDRTLGIGTLTYMAPEMYNDHYGSSVDIWAIGITLYQLMYNQLPFTLQQVKDQQFSFKTIEYKDLKQDCGVSEEIWSKMN